MKAAISTGYGPPDVLELRELPLPDPNENEVLVKIAATTVTSVDCTFRRGNQFFARLFTGITKPKNPVLGSEFSGVVEAVGKNVTKFKVGDPVFGGGQSTHAEYITIEESGSIVHKPKKLSFGEATAIPYGVLTALPFLRDAGNIEEGEQVLINGASGSVGSYAVQLAKFYGAQVTAVCSGRNAELVTSLGADNVIDYTKKDFTQNGASYDLIFDSVGKSTYSKSKRALKTGGRYLTTVLSFGILMQQLWTSKFGHKKAIIEFTGLRPPDEMRKDLLFISELVEAGHIKPVIDRRYSLNEIAEAHRYVEKGHKTGNVVIIVDKKLATEPQNDATSR